LRILTIVVKIKDPRCRRTPCQLPLDITFGCVIA